MWVDVYLPIEINDAAQIPWVPAGADEQWIKDYLDKYVKTPAFAAVLANLAVADNTLSNVDNKDFEQKGKDANFAQYLYVTHSENQFHSFRVLKRNPVKAWLGKRGEKHNKSIGVIAYNTITNEKKDMGP